MKLEMINQARKWYKFWSVRLMILGSAITGVFIQFPEATIAVWAILPDEMKSNIPPRYMMYIGLIVFALAIFARLVKQEKINKDKL